MALFRFRQGLSDGGGRAFGQSACVGGGDDFARAANVGMTKGVPQAIASTQTLARPSRSKAGRRRRPRSST
jgi:hypothetical protein